MNYQHINLSSIQTLIGNKPPLIKQILHEILLGSERNTLLLIENFRSENWNSLKGNAHFLKSNFRYLGNQKMVDILRKIELNSPDESKRSEIPSLVQEYELEYTQVILELKDYLQRL